MDKSGYTRSRETESVRKEIGGSFEDDYREDEERKEYENIVYEVQQILYDGQTDYVIEFINNLPSEQRQEVLEDRRVLWSAFGELQGRLAVGNIYDCYLLEKFFFKDRPEWLTMPEMVQTAKNGFGDFLRKAIVIDEYTWVVDKILYDKDSKDFVFATALGVVGELVSEDNESGSNWPTALRIAGIFLKDNRAEVIDFLEPKAVNFMDSARHGMGLKIYELGLIKKVYPGILERESVITVAKRQAAYILERAKAGEFQGLEELTSLQSVFSLTDTDLAADEETNGAARAYLVEKLCENPRADYAVAPDFQKCVKIAGAQKSEVYGGIYKDALVASLRKVEKHAGDEEVSLARLADFTIILNKDMSNANAQAVEDDKINDGEETHPSDEERKMDPEVKEAFKKAFVSLVGANEQAVCKTLDTHFVTNSRELLTDEDLAKAKEELLVNAFVDIGISHTDTQPISWLTHFVYTMDGKTVRRAVLKAFDLVGRMGVESYNFLDYVHGNMPRIIEDIFLNSRERIKTVEAEEDDRTIHLNAQLALFREHEEKGDQFGWDFSDTSEDTEIKELTRQHFINLLKKAHPDARKVYQPYICDVAFTGEKGRLVHSLGQSYTYEPDEAMIEAARVGGLSMASEKDLAYSINHLKWLREFFFKDHPEMVAEIGEHVFIGAVTFSTHPDESAMDNLVDIMKKERPSEPVSKNMLVACLPWYLEGLEEGLNFQRENPWITGFFEYYVSEAGHWSLLDGEEVVSAIKRGAIRNLCEGFFKQAQFSFERYRDRLSDSDRMDCLSTGLRTLLHGGNLDKFNLVEKQTWIQEANPGMYADLMQERDKLLGAAKKVGIMTIGTAAQQFQPREWSTMAKVLDSGEVEFGDKKKEATGISRIRKEIMAEYELAQEFVVWKPYKALLSYLGDESEAIIWEYIGQRDKHQMLGPVEAFVNCMNAVDASGGTSRKDMVQDLFARAGMGSGMQADVWRNIMGKMTPQIWKLLETTSAYPDTEPPLANKENINLLRIQNEIKLHQTPELRKAVADIPKDKPELRAYAAELMKYPTINIEAIVRFIKDPKAFWTSRSGAGETNNVVSALLRELDPSAYPNWSAEQSRDAIVQGSYDTLNSFEPIAVEWNELRDVKQRLQVWGNSVEEIDGDKTSGDNSVVDFKNIYTDVYDKLLKADPVLVEKSDKAVDMLAWASYAMSDEVLDASVKWCRDKGEVYAKRAVEYGLKQKLAEPKNQLATQERYKSGLETILRESAVTDDKRPQIEASIASAAKKIQELEERITAIIQSSELEMTAFADHLEKLKNVEDDSSGEKKKIVKEFWARVEQTDFKVSILHMAKRLAGKEFASLDEFRDYAVLYADRHELADRLSTFLDEAEKSGSIDWYQAEVLKPSSVESAIAGTLSATCDAFGHGKKAHFMANPVCTQFVLRQSRGKPKEWNTDHVISQSLVTDNRQLFDKPQDRWDFFTELVNNGGKIAEALTKIGFTGTVEDFLRKYINAEELIVLDSVEVPVNVQKKMTPNDVYKTLQDAFGALVQKNPRYDKSVRLGTQWSYIKGDSFPHAPNTDVWVAPLAYSDNLGLEQHKDSSIFLRDREKDAEPRKEIFEGPVNVRSARPQDALAIAMMEDIAFRRTGGEKYITGLLAMIRNLNVACLQSAHNEHAPIAFIEENINDKGEKGVTGYLIAQTRQSGDIYIDDTATTGEVKGTGTRLLMKLLTEAASDEQLKKKTIRMDCRGTTSALAISKPSSVSVLEMMGYRLQGPKHEEIATQKSDRLFSYALVPMAA